jgi:hypothetical protein
MLGTRATKCALATGEVEFWKAAVSSPDDAFRAVSDAGHAPGAALQERRFGHGPWQSHRGLGYLDGPSGEKYPPLQVHVADRSILAGMVGGRPQYHLAHPDDETHAPDQHDGEQRKQENGNDQEGVPFMLFLVLHGAYLIEFIDVG